MAPGKDAAQGDLCREETGELRGVNGMHNSTCNVQKGRTRASHHFAFFICAFCTVLAGCGYQFRVEGAGPTIGGAPAPAAHTTAPRMLIQNFKNSTTEPNLEVKYTAYTRREFSAGGGVHVVADSEAPDLVLIGQVTSVVIPTLAFTLQGTLESRVTVRVDASVEDARTKKVVWRQGATASSEFFVTNDLQFNRILQLRALEQAGRLIAEDLATRFLSFLESGAGAGQAGGPTPK
ncbi:MAG: hypothetical protein E6K58_00825 [Nitrospirae bacterium]|nr:MAG: hypothetical protein E6K58_00825 [Nitrospirota bacterium]